MTPDELRAKLAKSDAAALATFLVRLAEGDDALRERIETLALRAEQPSTCAASLERRLKRLRSGRSLISYETHLLAPVRPSSLAATA